MADLVTTLPGRHADGVVPGRDLVGRFRQREHRARDPAREPPREEPGEQCADRDGDGEAGDERQPLVAQLGPRLRDDDRPEGLTLRLEAYRLQRRRGRTRLLPGGVNSK